MNDYLKSASKNFDKIKPKDYLISPISTIDAEIIVELTEILKKLNAIQVVDILSTYKYEKDSEIRDKLLEFNTSFSQVKNTPEKEKEPESISKDAMVFLNEVPYVIKAIYYFEKIIDWDYENECSVFGIKLNETPDEAKKIPLYSNKKIFYDSEQDRDIDFNKLNDLLCQLP